MNDNINIFVQKNFPAWKMEDLGKYKYGKPNEEIDLDEFKEALAHGHFTVPSLHKPYLVVEYYIGSRRTEPLEILKEDIRLENETLFIKIPAKKHGERGGEIELPLSLYGMDLVKKRWDETHKGKRVFPFETSTAYRIIKRL